MGKYLWLALLTAVASCQPASNSQEAYAPATASRTANPLHAVGAPPSVGQAETMRLHDALMDKMDSLMGEEERLHLRASHLDTHTTSGRRQAARSRRLAAALSRADDQMMGWMHDFQKTDTVGFSAHQYADYWAEQQRQLRTLQGQTRTALDSARRIR